MPAMRTGTIFRPKLIAASVAACFALPPIVVLANPTGPSVVSGSASFASAGNQLTVVNSANAIIQWKGFSIGVNEITRFLQSSATSAVLNRVVGAGGAIPRSVIDGVLASNGRVFLLNPAGVVIGPTGRIDVAGFFASSLALSNDDFLHGRMNFAAVPGAGNVVNDGVIRTQSAGRVYLVAPNVENSGLIRAPGGQIVLAAGKSVELASADSPGMTVQVTAEGGRALNLGSLIANSGGIGMFGALVRNTGVAVANAAVAGPGGQIRFVASRDLTLDAGSVTSANGARGGDVVLQAQGGTNHVEGTVEATGSAGQGGTVQALGVRVGVIGNGVIDASGATGGGTVRVGGDEHGANPAVQDAQSTTIGPDGVIRADAGATGDGGRVIVWSDGDTGFYGSISARGGSQSGDGGFVETSGRDLQAFGSVDVGAANGAGGTWLLDPYDAYIVSGTGADDYWLSYGGGVFTTNSVGHTSYISDSAIASAVATSGSVEILASQDVNLQTNIDTTAYAGSLTLEAARNVNLLAYTIATQGNLTLTAAYGGGIGSITSSMPVGSTQLRSNGGAVDLSGTSVTTGGIVTGGGSLYVSAGGNVALGNIDASATSGGGSVGVSTSAGSVTTGSIDSAAVTPNGLYPGGSVSLSATTSVSAGNVTAGGNVAMQAGSGDLTAGSISNGYYGGAVSLQTGSGRIVVNGNIDAHGMSADASAYFALYGESGGSVKLYRTDTTTDPAGGVAVQVNGSILASGGNGYQASSSSYYLTSGVGGGGGSVLIGNGSGAPLRGAVSVTGTIDTHAGNGAAGYANSNGQAGSGGAGGVVEVYATGPVSLTALDTYGGDGGIGALGSGSPYGGDGGAGGHVDVTAASIATAAIDAHGGNGGAGGSYGGGLTPDGGNGGDGAGGAYGGVLLDATATGAPGAVTTGAIDTAGGAGGAGANAASPAGNGGGGGVGGPVTIYGGSVMIDGIASATGGAGGAGGAGNPTNAGGTGGTGGSGGNLWLDASSGTGIVTFLNGGYDASGGLLALGGADGGAGAGAAGLAGAPGLVTILNQAVFLFTNTSTPPAALLSPDLLGALIDGIDRSTGLWSWLGGGYENAEGEGHGKKGVGICKP